MRQGKGGNRCAGRELGWPGLIQSLCLWADLMGVFFSGVFRPELHTRLSAVRVDCVIGDLVKRSHALFVF